MMRACRRVVLNLVFGKPSDVSEYLIPPTFGQAGPRSPDRFRLGKTSVRHGGRAI